MYKKLLDKPSKKVLLGILLLVLALVAAACGGGDNAAENGENGNTGGDGAGEAFEAPVNNEDVVAKVNGESVYGEMYNIVYEQIYNEAKDMGQDVTEDQIKEQSLDIVIGNALLLQDANNKGYEVTNDEVEAQLEAVIAPFESEADLNEALEASNLTLEQLRDQIREDLMLQLYIAEEISVEVTDEEIEQFYNELIGGSGGDNENVPTLEEFEPQLRMALEEQKFTSAMNAIVDELRAAGEVEILI